MPLDSRQRAFGKLRRKHPLPYQGPDRDADHTAKDNLLRCSPYPETANSDASRERDTRANGRRGAAVKIAGFGPAE